jgi:hypothetical protein
MEAAVRAMMQGRRWKNGATQTYGSTTWAYGAMAQAAGGIAGALI